jgi:transcriptional regulator with XRE-family HTH domain
MFESGIHGRAPLVLAATALSLPMLVYQYFCCFNDIRLFRQQDGNMSELAKNLGSNIRQLREEAGFTQQQMAERSEIPRPTWASLESGAANPTLSVLTRVATALQVSIEELIGPPRAQIQFFRAGFGKTRRKSGAALLPLIPEAIAGIEISRLDLQGGAQLTGVPHTTGTREYLSCISGCVELTVAGTSWKLESGDAVAFRGDQRHSYRNADPKQPCQAVSVVCFM